MSSIAEIKAREIADTPLVLFECVMTDGTVERWSTHEVQFGGATYQARVVKHNLFDLRGAAEDGIDAISKISLSLANADSRFSQLARAPGWKGSSLTARFLFFDAFTGAPVSDDVVLFRGSCNPPDDITESLVRLTFTSRLNMARTFLPDVRIQRRCPWVFPETAAQRIEAVDGGERGRYSLFYRCGYSPDQTGGTGSLDGAVPFSSCDYTRAQCEERGMFSRDSANRDTARFGGVEFVPSSILVKTYGEKGSHLSAVADNEAKYNDFVPLIYGRAWYRPPIVFARNDGNLTRLEVLLGSGVMTGLLKVIVNGIEIPEGRSGTNMTGTGWYNVVSLGARNGGFNLNFVNPDGSPAGDPYGSMAMMSVVVPNRISDGKNTPRIEVLADGLQLATFGEAGEFVGEVYTNNPAWVLLDVLRRCGWSEGELDMVSFARTAAYCDEQITVTDLNGNSRSALRFQCNLVLRKRRSAADVIRGIRNGSALYLTYGQSGQLQLGFEGSVAMQQTIKPAGSNSTAVLDGGWPAFEFGDGSNGFSDILRRQNGEPAIRLFSRPTADTPNRYSLEFQDEFNEFQQDSLSLVDTADAMAAGQEISAAMTALGIPNFHQAARILRLQLDRSIRGNLYVQFETGLRSVLLRPGDLITLSYLREGFSRQLFRVIRIAPGLNYRHSVITAQIHDDTWYTGSGDGDLGVIGGGRQPGFEIGIPRPIAGTIPDPDGDLNFSITAGNSGSEALQLEVEFLHPGIPDPNGPRVPLLSLSPEVFDAGGSLKANEVYYYAVSAVNVDGEEGALSFVVRASTPSGADTCRVRLQELSFASGADRFHVYRGSTPSELYRIAQDEPIAAEFIDTGLSEALALPPDRNYHHSNFYWRHELLPQTQANVFSASTIGADSLQMIPDEYRGKTVRIVMGRGKGQELPVLSNTSTVLTAVGEWPVPPDSTSFFVIAEPVWQFACVAQGSPASFEVPNRSGATVHVSGRSANIHDAECPYELCPLTRFQIGAGSGGVDEDVPPQPQFGAGTVGQGEIEVSGISFDTTANTSTVTAGTLTVHYLDERTGVSTAALSATASDTANEITIDTALGVAEGERIQIGSEVLRVDAVLDAGLRYEVTRGDAGSTAAAHDGGEAVYKLEQKIFVLPFPRGFFGSPASGSYSYPVSLADARIAAADLYVTNSRGNSPIRSISFTATTDNGLRTLSGGQFALQVEGYLAVQSAAVPPLPVDASHSVRDVFAIVNEPPVGSPLSVRVTVDGQNWCDLTIDPGEYVSNVIDGFGTPLASGAQLSLDILSVGSTLPGRDLTAIIRM